MNLRVAALVGVLLVAAVPACDRESPPAPEPPGPDSGTTTRTITVDGREREFRLYRPSTLDTSRSVPLVVMLHGALGSAEQAESAYGWNARADEEGFLVAYPNGLNRSWAVTENCCGPPAREGVDDAGFVSQVVATVAGELPVDRSRVYAAGISNGGMLAYKLACETDVFAAIAPVSATQLGDCPSPDQVSLIHIHGTADGTVPYQGGPGKLDNGGRGRRPVDLDGPPVPDLVARWRGVDGCAAPEVTTNGPVTTSVAGCPAGRAVELITIAGAGHQWPGSKPQDAPGRLELDPPSPALDATATIWQFFHDHPGQ